MTTKAQKKKPVPLTNFPGPAEAPKIPVNRHGEMTVAPGVTIGPGGLQTNEQKLEFTMSDLKINKDDVLGKGQYGIVHKAYYNKIGGYIALKEIQLTSEEKKPQQISIELAVLMHSKSEFIVKFYGSFFQETRVYYGMEYMDGGSLDRLYADGTPEPIIARISYSMVSGLKYMKDVLQKIHRDVKPTNVLVNTRGEIKLCDFGVSGQLVQSIARTFVGCQHYMAPERINNLSNSEGYGVESDVWSLGVSLLEVALGRFPYGEFDSVFSQLNAIVNGETPKLPADRFSAEAIDFCAQCMLKDHLKRPTYAQLLEHPFLQKFDEIYVDVASWVHDGMLKHSAKKNGQPLSAPLSSAAATSYVIPAPQSWPGRFSRSKSNASADSIDNTPTPLASSLSTSSTQSLGTIAVAVAASAELAPAPAPTAPAQTTQATPAAAAVAVATAAGTSGPASPSIVSTGSGFTAPTRPAPPAPVPPRSMAESSSNNNNNNNNSSIRGDNKRLEEEEDDEDEDDNNDHFEEASSDEVSATTTSSTIPTVDDNNHTAAAAARTGEGLIDNCVVM